MFVIFPLLVTVESWSWWELFWAPAETEESCDKLLRYTNNISYATVDFAEFISDGKVIYDPKVMVGIGALMSFIHNVSKPCASSMLGEKLKFLEVPDKQKSIGQWMKENLSTRHINEMFVSAWYN